MSKIKILPELIINQIAAGEVVERPASIVKELVENAIDAKANQIFVTVKNGGKDFISVLDNGIGMNETDARLSVERHATSKIYEEPDLFQIHTLGFRGEALASIASVSQFELVTCADEKQGATRLVIKGGHLDMVGKTGFPQGTKITVEQLFFNTPARLKFLKTTNTEFQHIQSVMIQQALNQPHIQFRLTHNQQVLFNLPKNQTLEQRIYQLFGESLQNLIPVRHQETYLSYEGFISQPADAKTSKRWQYLFVNGRYVKCLAANHAIYAAYRQLLSKQQHPAFFLNIKLDPSEIDVNVHPAKTEIRFRNSQLLHAILSDHLHRRLMDYSHQQYFGEPLPELENSQMPPTRMKRVTSDLRQTEIAFPEAPASTPANAPENVPVNAPKPSSFLEPKIQPKHPQKKRPSSPTPTKPSSIEPPVSQTTIEPENTAWRLGVLKQGYVVLEQVSGLWLVHLQRAYALMTHQHHVSQWKAKAIDLCTLEVPVLMELSPQDGLILEQYQSSLQEMGVQVELFGRNTYALQAFPEFLNADQTQQALQAFLEDKALFGKQSKIQEGRQQLLEKMANAATPDSTGAFTDQQMHRLFDFLEQTSPFFEQWQQQPIAIEMAWSDIENRFQRKR